MVSSKFSRRPRIQQPPPVCKSKKKPVPPPPPPPWPPTQLAALVHWNNTVPNGAPALDVETVITLDKIEGLDRYEGSQESGLYILTLKVHFDWPGPNAYIYTEIVKTGVGTWYIEDDVPLELEDPFNPPIFRLYGVPGAPWMWCDITLSVA